MGLVFVGVLVCPDDDLGMHTGYLLLWTVLGIVFLLVSLLINDVLLARGIKTSAALLDDNLSVALFEAGSFVSSGILLNACVTGGGDADIGVGLAFTAIFWALAQVLFLIFCYVYRFITAYSNHTLLKEGNAAAGIATSFTLIALAVVFSYPLLMYSSIPLFMPTAVAGGAILILMRFICDHFLLPGDKLDGEIVQKNWGAACIEGAVAFGIGLVMNLFVPKPGGASWSAC